MEHKTESVIIRVKPTEKKNYKLLSDKIGSTISDIIREDLNKECLIWLSPGELNKECGE